MRRILIVAVAAASLLSMLVVGSVAAIDKPGCPAHKPLIADLTLGASNVADFGQADQVWALDQYMERIRVWHVGTNQFCLQLDDEGSFNSFAGVSPGLTGTISAGVTGSFVGTRYLNVAGILKPDAPSSGHLGDFDADCDQQGVCANFDYRATRHLFGRVNAVRFGWFMARYDAGSHGIFIQSTDGVSGDITG